MFNFPYISREAAEALETTLTEQLENKQTNSKYYVFLVWGIGGVGKTTLTQKLAEYQQYLADFSMVSFGITAGIGNSIKLMNVLYNQLPENNFLGVKSFSSDPFKELYQKYWDTINELETTPSEGKTEVDSEQQKLVKQLISEGASTFAKFTPAAVLPENTVKKTAETVVDTAGIILSEADRVKQLLQQHRKTKDKRELKELMWEPLPKLTEAFLESCKQHKKPVILVLDTYEKVSPDIDAWLWKYLIGNAKFTESNIYVVIAGRNNILKNESWRKLQQDTNFIYDRPLERFDQGQTETYLQSINIRDKSTIEQIFKVTKGLPYYLGKIRDRIERKESIDFSQLNQDIVSLLLQGLNNTQKRFISLAACCRWFDKQVIKCLIEQQENLDFKNAVDENINCFEWLIKRDFVEYINGKYRLDDVARDVFRQEFWREDEQEFRQTHQQLADYFKKRRNEQLYDNSSPAQQYDNPRWRDYTSEFLYHQLYAGTENSEIELISYLFTSRYFKQDDVVKIPVEDIISEVDIYSDKDTLLIYPLTQCLKEIRIAIEQSYDVLESESIPYWFLEVFSDIKKADVDQALNRCFRNLPNLTGIAKFAGLLYKSKRCQPSQKLDYLQQAKTEAEKIVTEDDPEFSCDLFLWSLGHNFYYSQAYQQAVDCCQIAVNFKPDKDEAWYNRGVALFNLGRFNDAIASFDKALEFKPDKYEAWNYRGIVLGKLGRFDDAIASYNKALEFKLDYHEAWNNRGIALGKLGRFDDAIASYDKALELKPDYHEAWNNRGIALGKLGRFDDEIASYNKALEIKPDYHDVWYNRGIALGKLGRFDDEIASYNKVLEIKPDLHEAYYNKACAYALQNNIQLAIENLQQGINLDVKYKDMAKTDTDFDNIRDNEQFKELLQ
ncbi:tetratricopeptide repeat protein [Crocosphaera sp.]|uniref:tetratricopeptide repeat protein n=1 Tax=Crocosphaera sp. TaxID=2729996 RepID=UPI00261C09B0|nr:tetratricopeptide repeat protein [Crocosphaera sp.]MDJ0582182.1 tetratricopeptide repeat protein [Crocosphaera sp.]